MAGFTTDIVIIGAGPVGLFAVFEAGMLGLRCHVLDALSAIGGQLTALYPEKPIYDIPGFPRIDAAALVDRLAEQAAPFAPRYHLSQRAHALAPTGDGGWRATTDDGTTIADRAVIVAAGAGAFGPNRPPLPGIEAYEDRGVFYFVRRREDFRDKRVVIAGGGDSALDWALSLAEVADHVALVHRRERFRGAPETVARVKALAAAGAIELVVPYQLAGLEGGDGALTAVMVRRMDGTPRRLEADALLAFYGLATSLGPLADWGFGIERGQVTVDPATCGTTVPGVFAIGDIAAYPGKLKLILTGFAEAACAAHAIYPLVHPDTALHFEYSTTTGVPGFTDAPGLDNA